MLDFKLRHYEERDAEYIAPRDERPISFYELCRSLLYPEQYFLFRNVVNNARKRSLLASILQRAIARACRRSFRLVSPDPAV
jgi:hypothetical protein